MADRSRAIQPVTSIFAEAADLRHSLIPVSLSMLALTIPNPRASG